MKYIKPLQLRKDVLETLKAIKSDSPSIQLVQRTATEKHDPTFSFIAVRKWVQQNGDMEVKRLWAK